MDYGMLGSDSSDGTPPGLAIPHPTDMTTTTEGLIFERQFQQFPPLVTVKNTFIDGWAEEDDRSPPMVAAKSCPAPASHLSEDDAEVRPHGFACLLGRLPAEQSAKARQLAMQFLPNPAPDALPAYVRPRTLAEKPRPGIAAEAACEPAPQAKATKKPLPPHVTPLEFRGPEMSLGSVDHGNGECRPCAWFWRPQGCNNGEACRHCHLCLQGEVKARRKTKLVSLRKQGRAAQRASQKNDSEEAEDADGAEGAGTPTGADGARCPLQLTNLV